MSKYLLEIEYYKDNNLISNETYFLLNKKSVRNKINELDLSFKNNLDNKFYNIKSFKKLNKKTKEYEKVSFAILDNSNKSKKIKIDKFHIHEALHTTNMLTEMIAEHLQNHWYYQSNKNSEFNNKIDEAIKNLCDAYQLIGEKHV